MTRPSQSLILSPLRHIDAAALKDPTKVEVRARQHHLPPVSVYRWWARRTETVSGAVIDAVAEDVGAHLTVADPFAGGGVIALAALLRGHRVYAQDINPWAARSLATMLSLPSPDEIDAAADMVREEVADLLTEAYGTTLSDGEPGQIVHTLRVAAGPCPACGRHLRLFPAALVSLTTRIDAGAIDGFLACPEGHLQTGSIRDQSSRCNVCSVAIDPAAQYTSGRRGHCQGCDWTGPLADVAGPDGFDWEVALVERRAGRRREITLPTPADVESAADESWNPARQLPVIDGGIETGVLRRHGLTHWHDLYPARQRVVIERLLDAAKHAADGNVLRALEAAIIGSTEIAGRASRWDARYLKAYEVVANHRYSFTTLAVEPNVWGAEESGRGTVHRRLQHLAKASVWLDEKIGRSFAIDGPRDAVGRRVKLPAATDVRVVAGSSQRMCVLAGTLDAVVTDPPFHDDVHYAELSDLFRAWAGEDTGSIVGDAIATQLHGERGTEPYRELLTGIFGEIRRGLRPEGHLILSYANREPSAWVALFTALQDAGFVAVGYEIVYSENEIDYAKAGRRACTFDVLIDVVPAPSKRIRRHRPKSAPDGPEGEFCGVIGGWALNIGRLEAKWAEKFTQALRDCAFLRPVEPDEHPTPPAGDGRPSGH